MATWKIADQFVSVLLQEGVQRIYGVVGDNLNPLADAIRRTDGIDWVHVPHPRRGSGARRRR